LKKGGHAHVQAKALDNADGEHPAISPICWEVTRPNTDGFQETHDCDISAGCLSKVIVQAPDIEVRGQISGDHGRQMAQDFSTNFSQVDALVSILVGGANGSAMLSLKTVEPFLPTTSLEKNTVSIPAHKHLPGRLPPGGANAPTIEPFKA